MDRNRFLARVSPSIVAANRVGRAGEPLFVMTELFQCFDGKELGAVARRMAQGFQEAGGDEDRNFVRLEAKERGGLGGVEPGRSYFPTQELGLLFCNIHTMAKLPFEELWRVYQIHKTTQTELVHGLPLAIDAVGSERDSCFIWPCATGSDLPMSSRQRGRCPACGFYGVQMRAELRKNIRIVSWRDGRNDHGFPGHEFHTSSVLGSVDERRGRTRNWTRANHALLRGKEPEEDSHIQVCCPLHLSRTTAQRTRNGFHEKVRCCTFMGGSFTEMDKTPFQEVPNFRFVFNNENAHGQP